MVYEELGKWVLWIRGGQDVHLYFDTQMEAMTAMAKLETARAIVAAVKSLATAADSHANLVAEYWDVSAAFGAFTVDDVAAFGITLAQLQAGITLLEQFGLLVTGANDGAGHSTITPSDYLATINTLRRVAG